MRGYVYLDANRNLVVKDQVYIDEQDPGFFQRNKHLILLVWKFNTDSDGEMYELMSSFKRRQLDMRTVQLFCTQVNFDLRAFLVKNKQAALVFAPQAATAPLESTKNRNSD